MRNDDPPCADVTPRAIGALERVSGWQAVCYHANRRRCVTADLCQVESNMPVQTIIRMGHPTLRRVADPLPVDEIGRPSFKVLVANMRETLHAYGGIGLAAPQIDVSCQLVVVEITDSKTRYGEIDLIPFSVFVNPSISVIHEEVAGYWEGCLSIPGMMGYVERPQHIRIDYLDATGVSQSIEPKGFLATVFQHELDHLQGTLYVDRLKDSTLFAFEDEYHLYHQDSHADEPE